MGNVEGTFALGGCEKFSQYNSTLFLSRIGLSTTSNIPQIGVNVWASLTPHEKEMHINKQIKHFATSKEVQREIEAIGISCSGWEQSQVKVTPQISTFALKAVFNW